MISRDESLRITEAHFPQGPEKLAEYLGIPVLHRPLSGFDGWCAHAVNTNIVVNSKATMHRQRFTLAHELAHLVLGTESDIYCRPFESDRKEEREADALAAEFLLPFEKLVDLGVNKAPIVAKQIQSVSKVAKVSPVVTACRLVSLCSALKLSNAGVVYREQSGKQWTLSEGLQIPDSYIDVAIVEIRKSGQSIWRKVQQNGKCAVASLLETAAYQLLFLQLLPESVAKVETVVELTNRLRNQLFDGDEAFERSVSGCLSAIKQYSGARTLDAALAAFEEKHFAKFTTEQQQLLSSECGQAFLTLRLKKWFR